MGKCIQADLLDIVRRGHMAGRRIVLVDHDTNERNIYEDLDQETITSERMVLVTLEPAFTKAVAAADNTDAQHQTTVTHEKAIADIQRMLRLGYRLLTLTRDLGEKDDDLRRTE